MKWTFDGLFEGEIKFLQPRDGYRFSVDAPILAFFVKIKGEERIIDLGTGNGVILIILGKKYPHLKELWGIEIQRELFELAQENVKLNGLSERIRVIQGDVREIKRYFSPQSFQVVISNPPYYPVSWGRINPQDKKALARHEILGTIEDFLEATSYLLKERGRCYFIYPQKRAITLFVEMRKRRLEPKRLRFVHPKPKEEAKMVLIEGLKGGGEGLVVEPPLYIFDEKGSYTEEMTPIIFKLKEENR